MSSDDMSLLKSVLDITYVCYNAVTGMVHTNKFEGLHYRLHDIHGRIFNVKFYSDVDKVAFAVHEDKDYA